jgi:uncharacterized protein (DUF1330 family)
LLAFSRRISKQSGLFDHARRARLPIAATAENCAAAKIGGAMATYAVVHVEKVRDREGLQRYLGSLPPLLAKFGGEFIMRGRPVEGLMGAWEPQKEMYALGVIRFENAEQIKRWFNADEYKEAKALLKQSADVSLCVFEGLYGL